MPKQSSASLKRAIKNLSKRIKEHEEYIENPREVIMMANEKLIKEGIEYIIGRLLKMHKMLLESGIRIRAIFSMMARHWLIMKCLT